MLSGRDFRERRDAVREAYAFAAGRRSDVAVRFVLSAAEASAEVLAEQQAHGDLIFAPDNATDYRSILAKTLHVSRTAWVLWVLGRQSVHGGRCRCLCPSPSRSPACVPSNAPPLSPRLPAPQVFEHVASELPGTRMVLKTDDDAWVNVPRLLSLLRASCLTPGCAGREALYMGHFLRNARVITDPNHKW